MKFRPFLGEKSVKTFFELPGCEAIRLPFDEEGAKSGFRLFEGTDGLHDGIHGLFGEEHPRRILCKLARSGLKTLYRFGYSAATVGNYGAPESKCLNGNDAEIFFTGK